MKISVALLFAMLVFVVQTNARPDRRKFNLLNDENFEPESDFAEIRRERIGSEQRVRHSRQTFAGYGYPYPQLFESRSILLLEEINMRLKLLGELLSSRTSPCQRPQMIPFPYPLPINMTSNPDLSNRFNPIWGVYTDNVETPSRNDDDDDDDDGARPISFKPSKHDIPEGVRTPPVEHGSIQADKSSTPTTTTTLRPVTTTMQQKKALSKPTLCGAAVISCCRFSDPERKNCFTQYKCTKTYNTGFACEQKFIDKQIEIFINEYKPR